MIAPDPTRRGTAWNAPGARLYERSILHSELAPHPNARVLDQFFSAVALGEAAMAGRFYADDARIDLPPIGLRDLPARDARRLWQVLLSDARDLHVQYAVMRADDHGGEVAWIARYTWPPTGRLVTQRLRGQYEFRAGRIVWQSEGFSLWDCARMALGSRGLLGGWNPLLRARLRRMVRNCIAARA